MTITVSLPQDGYPVYIGADLLAKVGEQITSQPCRRWAVIADETVAALFGEKVLDSLRAAGLAGELLTFPAGERSKTPETWLELCRALAQRGFTRQDGVLSLGGGVTGDIAGFAAACYQRGMMLVQLPTTLLAQVDSAVGGKAAVDLPEGKNLLGAFYQPRMVLADTDCLATLSPREFRSGVAEVIKCGMIRDAAILTELESHRRPDWAALIGRCLQVKAALVAEDERDAGQRRLLNFGHTFGHAYEAAGGYETCTHGEAVAAGMAEMLRWQLRRGDDVAAACDRLVALLERYDLPTRIDCGPEMLRRYMARDKKREGTMLQAVLLRDIGDAYVESVPLLALCGG